MKNLITIISTCFICTCAHAQKKVLVFHRNVEDITIRAQKTSNADFQSYDDFYIKYNVDQKLVDHLTQAFMLAQESQLSSELTDIELKWHNVIAFTHKFDWHEPQRRMLQVAYVRLAQLSHDTQMTNKLLQQSIQLDLTYTPDEKVFQPPIIAQYNFIKNREDKIRFSTRPFIGFSKLLINGVIYDVNGRDLEITNGVKRFTWLSERYSPVTQVFESKDLLSYIPTRTPLVAGTCEAPQFNSLLQKNTHNADIVGVFSGGCKKNMNGKNEVAPYKPVVSLTDWNPIEQKQESQEKKFYQKPKFWLGAAAATATLVILKSWQEQQSDRSSTSREGF